MANEEDNQIRKVIWAVIGAVVAIVLLIAIFGSYFTIPAGHRGVLMTMGKVEPSSFGEGFHLKAPFFQDVIAITVQTQKYEVGASAASSDLQIVTTTIAINFHISPDKAWEVYQQMGADYEPKVIAPTIQEAVKSVTAKFSAENLISKRSEVAYQIQEILIERLSSRGLLVEQVSIVNFDFSPEFNQAIEQKVTMEQNALAQKNKLEQVRYEAEQKVVTADAEGKSILLVAQAEANAIRLKAEALKENRELVSLTMAQRWNGAMPTVMMGSTGTPLFDMSSFTQQQ